METSHRQAYSMFVAVSMPPNKRLKLAARVGY